MSKTQNTSKKTILISPAFPYRGGIAATTDRLAKEYFERGENIEIWTYKTLYPKFIFPGKTQFLDLEKHDAPKNIIIKRKISSINPFNWFKVGRELKKEQPEKIIIRYWLPVFAPCLGFIMRIAGKKNIKYIGLIDNVSPHESRFGDKTLSKYFYKKLSGFLVMSKKGITELREKFNVKKEIIYSPHPLFDIYGEPLLKKDACKKLNLDPSLDYILSFGLVRKYKGVDLLIKAFAEFSKTNQNYRLLIVGECYDDWQEYQSIINDLKIEDKIIRFDSFIPDDQVKDYFSIANFLALTYRSATQSGVTQIAYSMDLPILVSNVGDLANMVPTDKVGLVTEQNNEAIVESLHKMALPENIERYRIGIKEEKKRFEWGILCDNLDRL